MTSFTRSTSEYVWAQGEQTNDGNSGDVKTPLPRATTNKRITLKNENISQLQSDMLYHFGLNSALGFESMFGDVKFVCMGGSPERMLRYAQLLVTELKIKLPLGTALVNLSKTDRYALYKVGPVLSVSHGMGIPSISIMLHEITKMLHYAKATDVVYIRIGSSGGLGVEPGSIVITSEALNSQLQAVHEVDVLGKRVERPTKLPLDLAEEIAALSEGVCTTLIGKTMCCNDFYEAQSRLDGAICEYTLEEKMAFLKEAHEAGVRNIEMETTCFAGFCGMLDIPAAVLCATYLNRLDGDQILPDHSTLAEYSDRPQRLATRFIKSRLGIN